MPIYEYKCENCDHQFEKIQKFSDKPLVKCPKCHQPTLNKLVSQGNFCLMGHGWTKPGLHASRKN